MKFLRPNAAFAEQILLSYVALPTACLRLNWNMNRLSRTAAGLTYGKMRPNAATSREQGSEGKLMQDQNVTLHFSADTACSLLPRLLSARGTRS